jgi:hypothetical protein
LMFMMMTMTYASHAEKHSFQSIEIFMNISQTMVPITTWKLTFIWVMQSLRRTTQWIQSLSILNIKRQMQQRDKIDKSNETPTWCNTVQVIFLQSHSTCFGRKRPSSGVFKN